MYVLVDCNNFYASCKQVFNPKLNHQPIVVLSNNDGCVIACSNETKPFVPMTVAFKLKRYHKEKQELVADNDDFKNIKIAEDDVLLCLDVIKHLIRDL